MTGPNQPQTTIDDEEERTDEQAPTDNTTSSEETLTATDVSDVANSEILSRLVSRIETLESENEELRNLYTELDKRVTILESRADHLNDSIESTEIELSQARDDITRKRENLDERITALEAELGLEEWDGETVPSQAACELEHIANLPDELRDDEFATSVNRAVIVWEHFEQWSKPVNNGQLFPSNEVRKLLSARLDKKLDWVQVYRVMDAFNRNTTDDYELIETENSGKSLFREYDE